MNGFRYGKFHHRHTPTHRQKISFKALQEQIKAQPVINTLCVDDKGGFWFSQERYGLCFYDPITERLTHYSTWTTGKRHLIAYPYKLIPSQTPGKIWSIGSKNHIFAFKTSRHGHPNRRDHPNTANPSQYNSRRRRQAIMDRDIGWALGL